MQHCIIALICKNNNFKLLQGYLLDNLKCLPAPKIVYKKIFLLQKIIILLYAK
jgi:hypothetical protein